MTTTLFFLTLFDLSFDLNWLESDNPIPLTECTIDLVNSLPWLDIVDRLMED